eukprot:m.248112 g.248112  ORF g.248112 m.248112 type:complete len:50 (+) comp15407_c1_seq5:1617-1766(+)
MKKRSQEPLLLCNTTYLAFTSHNILIPHSTCADFPFTVTTTVNISNYEI